MRTAQVLDGPRRLLLWIARHAPHSPHPLKTIDPRQYWARRYLSLCYVRGRGIEIGALHEPLPLYWGAKAIYLDRLNVEALLKHYPELAKFPLTRPEVIADGEKLVCFRDDVFDFLVANHFIEHCENPIGALESHLAKLRVGGILYLAVPNKDFTFDKPRPLTALEHLLADYAAGPGRERRQHYEEYALLVDRMPRHQVVAHANRLMAMDYSIHFHVWNADSFEALLNHLQCELHFPFEIVTQVRWDYNPYEIVFVLRKKN